MKNVLFFSLSLLFLQQTTAQNIAQYIMQNITLDALMSAPHLTNLTISPKTDKLVWVENTRGVRNVIFVENDKNNLEKTAYSPKSLTNWTIEDGQDITNLEWTTDERHVFFVKGNAPQVRGTQPHNPAQIAYKASPVYYIDGWKSPVLLAHGDDDQNVPFSESENIARLLKRQGVDFEQVIVPDEVHGFLMWQSWMRIYEATADFFNRKLKP